MGGASSAFFTSFVAPFVGAIHVPPQYGMYGGGIGRMLYHALVLSAGHFFARKGTYEHYALGET